MKMKKRVSMLLLAMLLSSVFCRFSPASAATTESSLGEIALFPYASTVPRGWALCDGRTMTVAANGALYSLIGTVFGGTGTTFNLPNLTGASPLTGAKYYMCTEGYYGMTDTSVLTLGQVYLLPDMLATRSNDMAGTSILLQCNGTSYDIGTYPALYAKIGTSFGTTLPNLTNMSPLTGLSYYIVADGIFPSADGNLSATDAYLGDVGLYAFGDTHNDAVKCTGQTLSASSYAALYALVGTTFGGNSSNFAVPDLQGAVPLPGLNYYILLWGIYPTSA